MVVLVKLVDVLIGLGYRFNKIHNEHFYVDVLVEALEIYESGP